MIRERPLLFFAGLFTEPPPPLTDRQRIVAWSLAVAAALSRLLAISRSAWDWDEMLFCLGMRSYDVAQHHPHPPGFPLFIALAKIVRVAGLDDFRALQTVSVVAAMLLFPAVMMLGRELRLRADTAMAAAALCAFFPNVWFFGGTAFSDVVSLTLAVFAVAMLLRGCRSASAYVAGAVLLAAAAAIRPQNLLIGLAPAVLATLHRTWRQTMFAAIAGIAVLAATFGPAIAATGGIDKYVTALKVHGDYIARVDSFRSPTRPPLWTLFDDFFVRNYQSPALGWIVTLFVVVALIAAIRGCDKRIGLLLLAFGPFAIFAWLMLDRLSISRFSIGYAPLFALLAAHGIDVVTRRPIVGGILVIAFAVYTWPALAVVRREDAPTIRAIQAARSLAARHQLYVARSMAPFVEYGLPREPYITVEDEHALPVGAAQSGSWLLSDFRTAPPHGLVFRRAHGRLWNIARRAYFDVALAPVAQLPQFVSGWYPPERLGHDEWRWSSGHAAMQLPATSGATRLSMSFDIPDDKHPPTMTLTLDGVIVDRFVPNGGHLSREYRLTPNAARAPLLEITVEPTYNERRAGTGTDTRELGILLRTLSWGPA
jgi:hypothetical protein